MDPVAISSTIIAQNPNIIDLTPLLTQVLMAVGVAVTALAAVLVQRLNTWVKAKFNVELAVNDVEMNRLLSNQVDIAVKYAIQSVDKLDWTKIETKNALVAAGTNFVINNAAGTIQKLNLSREQIEQRVTAALMNHDTNPGTWN
ncbi:hypothetical protein EBZ39_06005 [bacterium]|nr:hypothetical protein [bacterium]